MNLLKSFRMGTNKEITEVVNVFPNNKGNLEALNFKSFRGMIKALKRANTYCRKHKFDTEIRFRLPINW